jgi:hypothetical protein
MFVTNGLQPSSFGPQHFWTNKQHGLAYFTGNTQRNSPKMTSLRRFPLQTLQHLTCTALLKRTFCPRSIKSLWCNELFTPLLIQFSKSKSSFPHSFHLFNLLQILSNKLSVLDPKANSPRTFLHAPCGLFVTRHVVLLTECWRPVIVTELVTNHHNKKCPHQPVSH